MATILEALKGVTAYPVPLRTLTEITQRRGLSLEAEATQAVITGAAYNLSVADLLVWLALAPNVSQGGQSFSFTAEQSVQLRNRANALYREFGADRTATQKPIYGYKGSRL